MNKIPNRFFSKKNEDPFGENNLDDIFGSLKTLDEKKEPKKF